MPSWSHQWPETEPMQDDKCHLPQYATEGRSVSSFLYKKRAARKGGSCEKRLIDYLRRRNTNNAAAPKPANAKVEGSGTAGFMVNWKPVSPVMAGGGVGPPPKATWIVGLENPHSPPGPTFAASYDA